MKDLKTNLLILVIGGLIAFIFFRECTHQNQTDKLLKDVSEYSDTAQHYKAKNGQIIAFNKVLELENQNQLKQIARQDSQMAVILDGFKNIESATNIIEKWQILRDTIRLTDTIPCDFNPIPVVRRNPHYLFLGTIKSSSFILDTLELFNQQSVVIGEKKTGFLKRERRVEIVNSNPYIQTNQIGSYVIDDKKKWYETTWFQVGAGFVGGVAFNSYINRN